MVRRIKRARQTQAQQEMELDEDDADGDDDEVMVKGQQVAPGRSLKRERRED
jgi:hypothetical protein